MKAPWLFEWGRRLLQAGGRASARAPSEDDLEAGRRRMIEQDLLGRGLKEPRVLEAMERVPRHRFVREDLLSAAYDDRPLDIGFGQTISQPYIVAKMAEVVDVKMGDRILEIGLGCGYETAVLMELGAFVYGLEIVRELAAQAETLVRELGYSEFRVMCRDGYAGWTEFAPYDAAVLAAAPPEVPPSICEQVRVGGRIVAPVGKGNDQVLKRWDRTLEGWTSRDIAPVRFVPMTHGKK